MQSDQIPKFRQRLAILGQNLIDAALEDGDEYSVVEIVSMAATSLYDLGEESGLINGAKLVGEINRGTVEAIVNRLKQP